MNAAVATKRLRIAVLTRVFSTAGGGAETYSIRLVEQLAARHEVHVFAQRIEHDWPGVTYHVVCSPVFKSRWINQLWFAWRTAQATRSGFDIVHSHENTWHGDVQTVHVKPGRGTLLGGRSGWRRVAAWLDIGLSPRLVANLALEASRFRQQPGRHVVLASEALRAQVLAAYPQAAPMMSVITPGVALPAPAPSRGEARRLLGLPPSGVLLLFVGNDYARKGLDTLLAALPQLPEGAMLMVVGGPERIPAYKERARELGLAERVHFLGAMNDVDLAYRAATLLVHPTLEDTFAMVVLEAMSHGLPVVVSGPAHCGISALLQNGRDALLLEDPKDAGALAAAIRRLLAESRLSAELSAQGHVFAQAHSWEEAARRYEALYFDAAAARAAAGITRPA
jgi:glycosyltransferase involved in cell wall biosynthesis